MEYKHRFIIVGAGISGLSLGNALLAVFEDDCFVILERDPSLAGARSQGFSLTLQKRGLDAMRDSLPNVLQRINGTTQAAQTFFNGRTGNVMKAREFKQMERVPLPRVELREALVMDVASRIRWNETVVGVEELADGSVACISSSGTRWIAHEALFACDGVRSKIRSMVSPTIVPRRFPLMNVYGIAALADLQDSKPFQGQEIQVLDGDLRFFSKPYNSKYQMWQVCFRETAESRDLFDRLRREDEDEKAVLKQSRDLCLARVRQAWHQDVQSFVAPLIEASEADQCIVHELCDNVQVPRTQMRVLFLGDACHPMSPYIGQGANSAIVDACTVVKSLPFDDVNKIAATQEVLMQDAVKIVERSRTVTEFYHSDAVTLPGALSRFKRAK